MERSSFFNAVLDTNDIPDRSYLAEDFARYFASFIGNGVFPNPSTNLQVIASNNMTITIRQGKAWINGYFYENTDDYILSLDVADGLLNRTDRIVLKLDFLNREVKSYVKKGQYASDPIAPSLQRNADAYEICLADIKINKGAIKITQADITDTRLNKDLCGIVHGTVEQVDTTAIFNQFQSWYSQKQGEYDKDVITWTEDKKQAFDTWYETNTTAFTEQFNSWYNSNTTQWSNDFNTWFDTVKGQLDGDIAGNLANEINSIKADLNAPAYAPAVEMNSNVVSLPNNAVDGKLGIGLKGLTAVNLLGDLGDCEKDSNGDGLADGLSKSMPNDVVCSLDASWKAHGNVSQKISGVNLNDRFVSYNLDKTIRNNNVYLLVSSGKIVKTSGSGAGANIQFGYIEDGKWYNGLGGAISRTINLSTSPRTIFHKFKTSGTATNTPVRIYCGYTSGITDETIDYWFDGVALYDLTALGLADLTEQQLAEKPSFVNNMQSSIGSQRIKSVGKNLFDKNKVFVLNPTHTQLVSIDETGFTAKNIKGSDFIGYVFPTKIGKTYALNYNSSSEVACFIYSDVLWGSTINYTRRYAGVSFTAKSNLTTVGFYFKESVNLNPTKVSNIQIEEGSTATSYEPYKENKSYVVAKDKDDKIAELCSLPNGVKDEVKDGKLIKRVGKTILNGSEPWTLESNIPNMVNTACFFLNMGLCKNKAYVISDNFIYDENLYDKDIEGIAISQNRVLHIKILKSKLYTTDTPSFKAWLQANPTTVYYELAEPYELPVKQPSVQGYKDGTVIFDTVIPEVGFYTTKAMSKHPDQKIASIDCLYKVDRETGYKTSLDASKCVIASDKLSFTHADLKSGDLCDWDYASTTDSTNAEKSIIAPTNTKATIDGLLKDNIDNKNRLDIADSKQKETDNNILSVKSDLNAANANIARINNDVGTLDATKTNKTDYVRQPGYAVTTGTASNYKVTLNPAPVAPYDGLGIVIKAHVTNSSDGGTPMLNINNGQIAGTIRNPDGTEIRTGDIKENGIYSLRLDATKGYFILQGKGGGELKFKSPTGAIDDIAMTMPGDTLKTFKIPSNSNVIMGNANENKYFYIHTFVQSVSNAITKYDNNFNPVWTTQLPITQYNGFAIKETCQGGYLLALDSRYLHALIKIRTSDGQKMWTNESTTIFAPVAYYSFYSGKMESGYPSVDIDSSDNIYVGYGVDADVEYSYALKKYNSSLKLVWENTLTNGIYSVNCLSDNMLVCLGSGKGGNYPPRILYTVRTDNASAKSIEYANYDVGQSTVSTFQECIRDNLNNCFYVYTYFYNKIDDSHRNNFYKYIISNDATPVKVYTIDCLYKMSTVSTDSKNCVISAFRSNQFINPVTGAKTNDNIDYGSSYNDKIIKYFISDDTTILSDYTNLRKATSRYNVTLL